jgi:deoxyribonuclease (pyrimidine dimer)
LTRINIVPTEELSDQHLVAEYRELFMVGSALARTLKSPNRDKSLSSIPEKFTLNTGHVKFFYNKGEYLHKRYIALQEEMKARGMNPDPDRVFKREQWPDELYNDWTPSEQEQAILRERLQERIDQKPDWYRWSNKNDT